MISLVILVKDRFKFDLIYVHILKVEMKYNSLLHDERVNCILKWDTLVDKVDRVED